MSSIGLLQGFSGFGGGNFALGTGSKLLQKRSWIVIVGNTPPIGDTNNANAIATFLRRKLNLVPIRGSWTAPYALSRSRVTQYANILLYGGCISNEYTFKLNDLMEPRYNIKILRERKEGETWGDYIKDGIQCSGWLVKGVPLAGASHLGAIGVGQQKMGIRASQIVGLLGWDYEDTCVLAKAFMEVGADAGIYDLQWTARVPNMDVNPEGMAYTKRP